MMSKKDSGDISKSFTKRIWQNVRSFLYSEVFDYNALAYVTCIFGGADAFLIFWQY